MSDGRNHIAEELHAKDAEIGRVRDAAIEECARVAELTASIYDGDIIARAIRALKGQK